MVGFGMRLRELRKQKGLRQTDLGEYLHVGKSAISQWENGIRVPDPVTLKQLADIFDVSMDYLLCRTDISYKPRSKISGSKFTEDAICHEDDFNETKCVSNGALNSEEYDYALNGSGNPITRESPGVDLEEVFQEKALYLDGVLLTDNDKEGFLDILRASLRTIYPRSAPRMQKPIDHGLDRHCK